MITKIFLIGCVLGPICTAAAGTSPYVVTGTWPIGGDGGWDYPSLDSEAHRLYLSRATHVAVVDMLTGQVVGDIASTPGVHGIALASAPGRAYVSVGKADRVDVVDLHSLNVIAGVKVGSKPDAIVYDSFSHRVFVFNGHDDSASVIDTASNSVAATIALGGGPEFARSDGLGHVFVNIEDKNVLLSIDTQKLKVVARWPLPGCDGPSGLAIDAAHHRSFSACANSAMTILDTQTGKSLATLPIGKGVDGAEFDAASQNVFSANGEGTLTIVHETDPDHFQVLQTLPTARGARTVALDEKTHRLYLPTAQFGVAQPTAFDAHPHPPILPGSFVVLVVGTGAVTTAAPGE